MHFSKAKFPHGTPGFYLQPLAQFALANISQRQFLFLGDAEQIRNRQRIFWRALRRSSEIESGGGVGTRRLASSELTEHSVQMACSVYALQIPRKERHGLQGSQENCSRTVDVSLSQSHLRPPPGLPGRGGGEGGGVWGPRGLYLETHMPSKSLCFLWTQVLECCLHC